MTKTRLYFAVLVGLLPAVFSFAANRTWDNPDGGDFGDGDNWTGGVPGEADKIFIGAGGTYTIQLDQDRTVVGFEMDGATLARDVTLDLGGHTLIASGSGSRDLIVTRGSEAGNSTVLRIVNGRLQGGPLRVDTSTVSTEAAHVIVGQDGELITGTSGESRIGNGGAGLLEVIDNGRFEVLGLLRVGSLTDYPSSRGTFIINGSAARFSGTTVHIGSFQEGHMHIINGARADVSVGLSLATSLSRPDGSRGFLEVSTGGHLQVDGIDGLLIGNTSGNAARSGEDPLLVSRIGHATVASGGTIDTARLRVYEGSTLLINGGSVTAGGTSLLRPDAIYQLFLNEVDATPLQVNSLTITNAILDVQLGEDFVAEMGGIYTIIDYASTLTGSFVDTDGQTLSNGDEITIGDYVFRLDYGNRSDGIVGLELVAIPEPSTFVLLSGLLAVSGVVLLRRYKK